MSFDWTSISRGLGESYLAPDQFPQMLLDEEGNIPLSYSDQKGIATIGIGVNLHVSSYMALVLQTLGVFNSSQSVSYQQSLVNSFEQILLQYTISAPLHRFNSDGSINYSSSEVLLQNALDAELQKIPGFANSHFIVNTAQAKSIVSSIVKGFQIMGVDASGATSASISDKGKEKRLNDLLTANGITLPHDTGEFMALMSLSYTVPTLIGQHLLNALASGNRAEAWYQIRYRSNGGSSQNVGIAARRIFESSVFGLYQNPNTATLTESLQAYQMLQEHRTAIMKYENTWGLNPDGTVGYKKSGSGATALEIVDGPKYNGSIPGSSAGTLLTQAGIGSAITDNSLESMYLPAETTLLQNLVNVYPEIASSLQSYNFVSTNILVGDIASGPSGMDESLDTMSVRTGAFYTGAPFLLLAGTGNDTLTAWDADNVLIAGTGEDVLKAGPLGGDTLVGGAGSDTLIGSLSGSNVFDYNPGALNSDGWIQTPGGVETIIAPDGKGQVWVGEFQLTGDGAQVSATDAYTWTDNSGTQYHFTPNNGTSPGVLSSLSQYILGSAAPSSPVQGTLTVTGGMLGGGQIIINNFDLSQAMSSSGYLGIHLKNYGWLAKGANLLLGPSGPVDPEQGALALTAYVATVSDQPQTVTIEMSKGDGSAFMIDTGNGLVSLSNTVTLTIPAYSNAASFGLVNISDVTAAETVTLRETVTDQATGLPVTYDLDVDYTATTFQQGGTANDTITGDLTPKDFSTDGSGLYHYDSLGNVITDGTPDVNYNDTLYGSTGNDEITTGGGDNYVDATQGGNDTITGGSGNDIVMVGDGDNIVEGKGGQDIIFAGNGANRIYADSKVDLNTAFSTVPTETPAKAKGDFIAVGSGENTVVGGAGDDAIILGGGNDVVVLGSGNNTVIGGEAAAYASTDWSMSVTTSGPNTLDYLTTPTNAYIASSGGYSTTETSHSEVNFDASGKPVGGGSETIFGGAGNNYIFSGNGGNYLDLGVGNDVVLSGAGNDTIFAGSGNDTINAMAGNDYVNAGTGNQLIFGGHGNNTIIGGAGSDTLYAGEGGTNWADDNGGNNVVIGGSGDTTIYDLSTICLPGQIRLMNLALEQ